MSNWIISRLSAAIHEEYDRASGWAPDAKNLPAAAQTYPALRTECNAITQLILKYAPAPLVHGIGIFITKFFLVPFRKPKPQLGRATPL